MSLYLILAPLRTVYSLSTESTHMSLHVNWFNAKLSEFLNIYMPILAIFSIVNKLRIDSVDVDSHSALTYCVEDKLSERR
jgi:hypothetical protein